MTVYNKLKTAILAIIASQTTHAILIDPIQIQSAPGELLYAEMNFSQANTEVPLQVALASSEDLTGLGIQHRPPEHLNFFTRRTGQGSGVIVITSSRPMTEAELNFVVKIKEGQATRLQHIQSSLKRSAHTASVPFSSTERLLQPQLIVSEKDIALNLPVTTSYTAPKVSSLQDNNIAKSTDVLAVSIVPPLPQASKKTETVQNNTATIKTTTADYPAKPQNVKEQPLNSTVEKTPQQTKVKSAKQEIEKNKTAEANTKHVVSNNESLWSIAARIAAQTNRPIAEVMKEIQANNRHAFIQGDANRLRRGAALNLGVAISPKARTAAPVKVQKSGKPSASGSTKYRLNQAEMSLVADSAQDSAEGSAKKRTQQNQTSAELSLKVMTAREKTVKLQKNVTQLELALRQKDQRIQLLNARLAKLQQQLQQQQKAQKSIH